MQNFAFSTLLLQMKKLANVALLLSSLIGYLEWSNNKRYVFSLEAELFVKALQSGKDVVHPFIIIPLIGQLLIVFTLFQKEPSRVLSLLSVGCIGIIMLLLLVIGLLVTNFKIILFAMPFLFTAIWVVKLNWKKR
jgi:hypothetical protein